MTGRHDDDLQKVRALISRAPLHKPLSGDRRIWNQLCGGLDGITDRGTEPERLDALNEVRAALGMEPTDTTPDDDIGAAIDAGVVAVRAELEERLNARYDEFAENPLTGHLHSSDGYAVEKAGEAVHALRDGGQSGADYNVAFIRALREKLQAIGDGIIRRGYDDDVRFGVDDAIHILDQAEAAVRHGNASVDQRSLEILTRTALPALMAKVRELAEEIDADVERTRSGWRPPS